MEKTFEFLTEEEFAQLEDKIRKEISLRRKNKKKNK